MTRWDSYIVKQLLKESEARLKRLPNPPLSKYRYSVHKKKQSCLAPTNVIMEEGPKGKALNLVSVFRCPSYTPPPLETEWKFLEPSSFTNDRVKMGSARLELAKTTTAASLASYLDATVAPLSLSKEKRINGC